MAKWPRCKIAKLVTRRADGSLRERLCLNISLRTEFENIFRIMADHMNFRLDVFSRSIQITRIVLGHHCSHKTFFNVISIHLSITINITFMTAFLFVLVLFFPILQHFPPTLLTRIIPPSPPPFARHTHEHIAPLRFIFVLWRKIKRNARTSLDEPRAKQHWLLSSPPKYVA